MPQKHPKGWNSKTHYMSIGGQCGQSCPCCRSLVGDTLGSCPICNQLKDIQSNVHKKCNAVTNCKLRRSERVRNRLNFDNQN